MKFRLKRLAAFLLLLTMLLGLTACGEDGVTTYDAGNYYYYPSDETESAEVQEDSEAEESFYLIVLNDTVNEVLHLYNYEKQMEYQYYYGMNTQFYDKYGNYESAAQFTPGKAVWLGSVGEDGRLTELGMSDRVWEYDDVTRFETDPEQGILKIADSKYSYGSEAYTFSNDETVDFSTITDDDELSVVGIGKKILSVSITTGHGTLALTNTSLFEGSFLQLNTSIFTIITENMTMDIPEGTYELSVANNGWGGSTEITVTRDQTTTVDLDTIKGDGPSYGDILFAIDVADAVLLIDDEAVDYSEPIHLQYGKHSLAVITEDYDEWDRTLYVNSPEATIVISLSDESTDSSDEDTDEDTDSDSDSDEAEESSEDSQDSDSTDDSTDDDTDDTDAIMDYLKDYLSTISSILS